jgi:hypothetical protein
MISDGSPMPSPAHNISVWTPTRPTILRNFVSNDLDEAVDFANRVFELPQVGRIEVWEDAGRFDYRDFYEAMKPWHRRAMAARPLKPHTFRQRLFWLIEDWLGYKFAMRLPYP